MAMFENFPYTDMHNLNLDWIIKIAKDFLDQYTHIQQLISDGEESLQNLTTDGLNQLQEKADTLNELLQQWYNTHSLDIANQLAAALENLNAWYTLHQNYLDQTLLNKIAAFNLAADQKAAQTIASIPEDYTALSNDVEKLTDNIKVYQNLLGTYEHGKYYSSGYGDEASANYTNAYDPITLKPNTTYVIKNCLTSFTWLRIGDAGGVRINTIATDNNDGSFTFTTDDTESIITLYCTIGDGYMNHAILAEESSLPFLIDSTTVLIPNLLRNTDDYIEKLSENIIIIENVENGLTPTNGTFYSSGYGDTSTNASYFTLPAIYLKPDTWYSSREVNANYSYVKSGDAAGVKIVNLASFYTTAEGAKWKTPATTEQVILYVTGWVATQKRSYVTEGLNLPQDIVNPVDTLIFNNRILDSLKNEFPNMDYTTITLNVSKTFNSSTPGWGVTAFNSIISAVNSITDASARKRYKVLIEAGTDANPVVYDDWNTVYAGHAPADESYVGVIVPAYVKITTTAPDYPNRTVCYFDGHAGISDTMTYNDAYKKALFHLSGKCFETCIEGLTLRAKDVRYAFHADSNVDAYKMTWYLKNCIIDWLGSDYYSETGWFGHAVGLGIGYGGKGIIDTCKWIHKQEHGNGITGHTNGWNPGVPQIPTMPGATLEIINCDLGGYTISLDNSVNSNVLNNIIKFYNVVDCEENTSTGWLTILDATVFNN